MSDYMKKMEDALDRVEKMIEARDREDGEISDLAKRIMEPTPPTHSQNSIGYRRAGKSFLGSGLTEEARVQILTGQAVKAHGKTLDPTKPIEVTQNLFDMTYRGRAYCTDGSVVQTSVDATSLAGGFSPCSPLQVTDPFSKDPFSIETPKIRHANASPQQVVDMCFEKMREMYRELTNVAMERAKGDQLCIDALNREMASLRAQVLAAQQRPAPPPAPPAGSRIDARAAALLDRENFGRETWSDEEEGLEADYRGWPRLPQQF